MKSIWWHATCMIDDTSSAEALRVRIQQPVFWLRQERQYLPWQFCIIGDKIPFDPDLINKKRKGEGV